MYRQTMNYLSVPNNFIKQPSFSILNSEQNPYSNNNQIPKSTEKTVQEVWSKHNFDKVNVKHMINLNVKTTWNDEKSQSVETDTVDTIMTDDMKRQNAEEEEGNNDSVVQNDEKEEVETEASPSHHARRPPNAFLIFCKKHRPVVRQRYPNLENRGVTKILGEWWALLELSEKMPYNDLAKEYKDAFLSANPNFRWYKLPAPPLRTLATRPISISKIPTPLASPTSLEFNPGKLADESQLGGLTSLMGDFQTSKDLQMTSNDLQMTSNDLQTVPNDIQTTPKSKEHNNNVENATITSLPPKKRLLESDEEGITNQDLLDKVVDGIFAKQSDDSSKEVRKSDRMCKGKRYEIFMVESKLLGNKREQRLTQNNIINKCRIERQIDDEIAATRADSNLKLDLEDTIKRLAERTNTKIDFNAINKPERVRTNSEGSNSSIKSSNNVVGNFNLDLRITNLNGLSYDEFLRRKRENKKRKPKIKSNNEVKVRKVDSNLVGSKKRKNKSSITHLNAVEERNNDLIALETLAMVAANIEKISE